MFLNVDECCSCRSLCRFLTFQYSLPITLPHHLIHRYVTWEIAPGRLANGSIVDVWGRTNVVDWNMPGTGAPCTSTARPGRWRSFPYLAGIDGEEGNVLWGYLCDEWNRQHHDMELEEFNFFMLQADVLPNMGFSVTRKRLIRSFKCVDDGAVDDESLNVISNDEATGEGNHDDDEHPGDEL